MPWDGHVNYGNGYGSVYGNDVDGDDTDGDGNGSDGEGNKVGSKKDRVHFKEDLTGNNGAYGGNKFHLSSQF